MKINAGNSLSAWTLLLSRCSLLYVHIQRLFHERSYCSDTVLCMFIFRDCSTNALIVQMQSSVCSYSETVPWTLLLFRCSPLYVHIQRLFRERSYCLDAVLCMFIFRDCSMNALIVQMHSSVCSYSETVPWTLLLFRCSPLYVHIQRLFRERSYCLDAVLCIFLFRDCSVNTLIVQMQSSVCSA